MTAHKPQSEQGAALLVALLATVFLTILGLVLLQVLRGGLTQAASTEASIQAEALAQRGLDDAASLIRAAVDEVNVNASSGYHAMIEGIECRLGTGTVAVPGLVCPASPLIDYLDGQEVQADRGVYRIDILDDGTDNFQAYWDNRSEIPDYPYSRVLTVQATGTVGSAQIRTATKTAKIVVSTIHSVFKSPLSASGPLPEDGDISLNGAVYVVGDVLARRGNLFVYDKASFVGSPGSLYMKETAAPTIKGSYEAERVTRRNPATGIEETEGARFDLFEPFRDTRLPDNGEIQVATRYVGPKISAMEDLWSNGSFGATVNSGDFEGVMVDSDVQTSTHYVDQWVELRNRVTVSSTGGPAHFGLQNGVLSMDDSADVTINGGSLFVDYGDNQVAAATLAGHLTLSPSQAVVVKGDVVMMDGFYLKGNLFVQGSLKIIGSVDIEGAIFVDGSVEMKEMKSINGTARTPLVLAASGEIIFSDSRPDPILGVTPPTNIRAFLYSCKPVHLYGVETKIRIRGGVHGSEVSLNALREGDPGTKTDGTVENISDKGDSFRFTPTSDQKAFPPLPSNLQLYYDDTLFSDPPVGIPVADELNMFVQELKR